MEAATTLWYTTAKNFLLAGGGGRGKVHKVFVELEYILYCLHVNIWLIKCWLADLLHTINSVIQYLYLKHTFSGMLQMARLVCSHYGYFGSTTS